MIRKIIQIDREKCNGCGLCAAACHEGAIGMVEGKAKLLRDDYCDGLGDCLPVCPTDAISFVEREAAAYDEAAVQARMQAEKPGLDGRQVRNAGCAVDCERSIGRLRQWPVQIKLVPVNAPYFQGADLLVAADCTAYAYGNFHQEFIRNRITLIGCPKLDEGDYTEKLTKIISDNEVKSLTVVRMEVPCCGGIERAAATALKNSGKQIPWQVVTISTEGQKIEQEAGKNGIY